jgi:hypothetical protein
MRVYPCMRRRSGGRYDARRPICRARVYGAGGAVLPVRPTDRLPVHSPGECAHQRRASEDALGRKNKQAASKFISRRGPSPLPPTHSVAVLERYIRFAPRYSEFGFCLPSDDAKAPSSPPPRLCSTQPRQRLPQHRTLEERHSRTAAAPPLPHTSLACNARH